MNLVSSAVLSATSANDSASVSKIISTQMVEDSLTSTHDYPKIGISNPTGNRKRRMSKKERKALKKKKKLGSDSLDNAKEVVIAKDAAKGANTVKSVDHNEKRNSEKGFDMKFDDTDTSGTAALTATATATAINKRIEIVVNESKPELSLLRSQEEEENLFGQECLKSYTPIPLPTIPSPDVTSNSIKNKDKSYREDGKKKNAVGNDASSGSSNTKTTLGKWFPNALLIKCPFNYTNTGKILLSDPQQTKTESGGGHVNGNNDTNPKNKPRSSLLLFYQYINHDNSKNGKWSRIQLELLMTYLSSISKRRYIGGRIRVSEEGVNATVSAVDVPRAFEADGSTSITAKETLRHFVRDLQNFDPKVFASTDFKYIDNLSPDRHFKEMKVMPVQELVFYGLKEGDASTEKQKGGRRKAQQHDVQRINTPTKGKGGGIHLDADEYHEMLQKSNTVVIDVRNHYETVLGRFDGQCNNSTVALNKEKEKICNEERYSKPNTISDTELSCGGHLQEASITDVISPGAKYLDPLMRKSTDFPSWLSKDETKEQLRDKTVLMYCTGGIRCERASSYLKEKMGDEVNGVYQLKGGVERYLKAFPDGGFWRGKNFVFDKREAVGAGNLDGDGGVIQKKNKAKKKQQHSEDICVNGELKEHPSRCCICNKGWDRYVGKKKCYTCGVPVLMCDTCMSTKPDKIKGQELRVRCPLCISESITVPASEVEFTENGIRGTVATNSLTTTTSKKEKSSEGVNNAVDDSSDFTAVKIVNNVAETMQGRKAADSVLKWGGGHAKKKKDARQKKKDTQQMKRRLCQFGPECFRKDCYFMHPERHASSILKKEKVT